MMILNLIGLLGVILAVFSHLGAANTYSPAPGGGWESITSSSDGQYMYTADVNGEYGILASANYGSTWTSPGSGLMGIWYEVHTSGTGQYVVGIHNSNVDFSKDYGKSYKGTVTSVHGVAISQSGQYILAPVYNDATGAGIKVSSNYGSTFHEVANTAVLSYRAAGMSGSGQYMIASNYTEVRFSSDNGATFSALKSIPADPSNYWGGPFKFNYDGKYILLTSTHGDYFSDDYGKTFSLSTFPKGRTVFSYSGEWMAVAQPNVGVQVSNDYGKTWKLSAAPAKNWGDIAISSDGKRLVACEYRGSIYMSSDYGNTWTQKP